MNQSFLKVSFCFLLILRAARSFAQEPVYTNRLGMAFVRIEPGRMVVGRFQPPYPKLPPSANASVGATPAMPWTRNDYLLTEKLVKQDARPGFPVTISHPYYLGTFEVTQAQWKQVMGSNPSAFQGSNVKDDADRHPVEQVSWSDVQTFLTRLNALDKGRRYRLPTEFEWEYAARAGADDDIPWKTIQATAQMGSVTTSTVGQKTPNAWGLYDMLGNVWEWVQDYYNGKPFADPTGSPNRPIKAGSQHVLKGASFMGDVKNATYMTHAGGPGNGWDVGFRVVMETR